MLKTLRYFMFSFVTAFFAWAVLYMFLVYVVHPKTVSTVTPAGNTPLEEPYTPLPRDSITVLFMASPQRTAAPGAYLIAHFNPVAGHVALAALPANTAIINGGQTESLSEIYNYGGALYTQELIAKTLGISIDRYVRVSAEAFLGAMRAIGSMEYNLPETLNITQDGVSLELKQGIQLLDGQRMLQILSYPYQSAEAQTSAVSNLAAELITQRRDIALSTMAEKVFTSVINKIDSDISYNDYFERREAANYFALLNGSVTHQIALVGKEENELYHLSDTFIAELCSYTRLN